MKKEGKEIVGMSAVRESYLRLAPVKITVKKRPQGTNDPHTAWAKASFNFAKQMAIRYGKLDPRTTPDPPMPPLPNPVSDNPPVTVGTDAPLPFFGTEPLPD